MNKKLTDVNKKGDNKVLKGKKKRVWDKKNNKVLAGNDEVREGTKIKKIGRGMFKVSKELGSGVFTVKQKTMINQTVKAVLECNDNKSQASELLGISVQALYGRFNRHPIILKKIEEFNKMTIKLAREKLNSNALISANEVITIANQSKSDNTRLSANLEILDRAGISKPQPTNNIQVNVLNKLREDIKEFDI